MPAREHPLTEVVRTVVANNPAWGPERIRAALERSAEQRGVSVEHLPSLSTIGRIKRQFPEDEHAPYRYVRWPETFEAGLLPWEAAPVALDLLRDQLDNGDRPTVRYVLWCWRVDQSAPGLDVATRRGLAFQLALSELGEGGEGGGAEVRDVERMMVGLPPVQREATVSDGDAASVAIPELFDLLVSAGVARRVNRDERSTSRKGRGGKGKDRS